VSSPSYLICKRVFFYSAIGFLYYSFTTELLLSLIYIKGLYPSTKTFPPYGKSSLALWLWRRPNSCKIATRIRTFIKRLTIFGLAKRSRTSENIYAVISFIKPKAKSGRTSVVPDAPHLLSNNFDAWRSSSRHENRKQNVNMRSGCA